MMDIDSIPPPLLHCMLLQGMTDYLPSIQELTKTIGPIVIYKGSLLKQDTIMIKEMCGGTTATTRSPHRGHPRELRIVGPTDQVDKAYQMALSCIEKNLGPTIYVF